MNESNYQFRGTDDYIISDDLMLTANIAIRMNKPLLVKGEPGTGKTALAESIAKALGKKLIVWSIKSTTKAQDGLYQYDVVRRLYDSELGNEGVDDVSRYIKMGKIGEAFCADEQCVLLIDEIDKADLEFPNDLLWELDRMEFYIPETDETIKAFTHRYHHIQCGERTAGCFPAPVCLPFHRVPGRKADEGHHPGALSGH